MPSILKVPVCVMILTAALCGQTPRVLFFANPMRSDNDVIRRSESGELSIAERRFLEITKGVFEVTVTQDGAQISLQKLKDYDAVVFFTAINPPGVDKQGLLDWVRGGGAFVGIHSTANTYQDFPPFGEMLGARFDRGLGERGKILRPRSPSR